MYKQSEAARLSRALKEYAPLMGSRLRFHGSTTKSPKSVNKNYVASLCRKVRFFRSVVLYF